jgi:hypothetical protein
MGNQDKRRWIRDGILGIPFNFLMIFSTISGQKTGHPPDTKAKSKIV